MNIKKLVKNKVRNMGLLGELAREAVRARLLGIIDRKMVESKDKPDALRVLTEIREEVIAATAS